MEFSKEEKEIFSLIDSLTASHRRLSKETAEAVVLQPSPVVLLLATVTHPPELLHSLVVQKAIPATLLQLHRAPQNAALQQQRIRLLSLLVILETSKSDELIDSALESTSSYDADLTIQALARADIPWHHGNLPSLLESENEETVAAAAMVLIEESLAQFYDGEDDIGWEEFLESFDVIGDYLKDPPEEIGPENLLKIGWLCAKSQYIQYFEGLLSLRDSFDAIDQDELDAILFGLDSGRFAHEMLQQNVGFGWLDNRANVANAIEAATFATPFAYREADEAPVELDPSIPCGLAVGYTSQWIETLALVEQSEATEVFEFAAVLASASAAAVRAFAINYTDASQEELDELSLELAEIVASDELPPSVRRPEFAVANLLTDDVELEELLVRVAAHEVILAMNEPLPAIPGLPLSGASADAADVEAARELLMSDDDAPESVVRRVRTILDAATWSWEKEPNAEVEQLYNEVLPQLEESSDSVTLAAAGYARYLSELGMSTEYTPGFPACEIGRATSLSRLAAIVRARRMGQYALKWFAEMWLQPPISSAAVLRDTFVNVAVGAGMIEGKFVL